MEMLLLRHWREELTLDSVPMSRALDAIGSHQKTGNPLRQLQDWLYRPASSVRREEIAAVLSPYTLEAPNPEVAP